MGYARLRLRVHLAEGLAMAVRHEDRVVTETPVPARRPGQPALHAAFEALDMPVRPGERERGDEGGLPRPVAEPEETAATESVSTGFFTAPIRCRCRQASASAT